MDGGKSEGYFPKGPSIGHHILTTIVSGLKIQLPELFIQKCILVDLRDVDRPLFFIEVFYQLV